MSWKTLLRIPTVHLLRPTKCVEWGGGTVWVDPGPLCPEEKGAQRAPSPLSNRASQSQLGDAAVELALAFYQLRAQQKGKGSCTGMRRDKTGPH